MLQFDNEAARKLETIYSSPDVVAQRSATLERLRLRPGEEVIDVGCGPGFLCEQMAAASAQWVGFSGSTFPRTSWLSRVAGIPATGSPTATETRRRSAPRCLLRPRSERAGS